MVNVIVKEDYRYAHYNRALGKHIKDRAHYEREMVKGGYIPYEVAQDILKDKERKKEIKHNPELVGFLRHLYSKRRKNGEIKLEPGEIAWMEKFGVSFQRYLPDYITKGK